METPRTLLEAVNAFADPGVAHDFFVKLRWPHFVACPRPGCGSADVRYVKTRRLWFCRDCKRQFTAKVGTIFEDSPIGFDKWLPAIWMLSNDRNGISSCELARALGVTQKTAWFLLHRARLGMKSETYEQLTGRVEADETYIGGKVRHPRPGLTGTKAKGPGAGKATVMGMIERGGKVRAFVVADNKRRTLLPKIFENVAAGSVVYTDALKSYASVRDSYAHFVINHAEEYVRDHHVHTNSIENFWSVLKRTIGGTYICPRAWHLDRYLDEQIFRFNARKDKDAPRFIQAVKGVEGKRMTYRELIAH
jgi:transposase-like protein